MTKRKLLSFILAFIIYGSKASSEIYTKEYNKGLVYIGTKEEIELLESVNEDDILVIDKRDEKDPDMRVLSSYQINNRMTQKEILEILLEYEKLYPSDWDRSLSSMQMEWLAHNFMAFFSYKTERTFDVDFNNHDEEKYKVLHLK